VVLKRAGLCATLFASTALASPGAQSGQSTASSAPCDCYKDCKDVEVVWERDDGPSTTVAHALDDAIGPALDVAANWLVDPGTWSKDTDKDLNPDTGERVRVRLVSCRTAECRSRMSRRGFEIVNARMLARPLYVFVRRDLGEGTGQLRVVMRERVTPVSSEEVLVGGKEIENLLSEVLKRRVLLRVEKGVQDLVSALGDPEKRTDAVVLFGDEPDEDLESFTRSYENRPTSAPRLLLRGFTAAEPWTFAAAAQASVRYVRLEYPGNVFYRNLARPNVGAGGSGEGEETQTPATVGLAPNPADPDERWPRLPVLFTNAGSSKKMRPCCLDALRRAVGGAALLAYGRDLASTRDAAALHRSLLMHALLASRADSEPILGELLCAGALAGHLNALGTGPSRHSAEVVLRSVGESHFEAAADAITKEMSKLNIPSRDRVRRLFSRDVALLGAGVPQTASLGTGSEDVRQVVDRLLAALHADPAPARRKGGAGMTHADNYNPFLQLAKFWMLHRAELGSPAPGRLTPRLATDGTAEPGTSLVVHAAVFEVDVTAAGAYPHASVRTAISPVPSN
jgi:hypothetical protein